MAKMMMSTKEHDKMMKTKAMKEGSKEMMSKKSGSKKHEGGESKKFKAFEKKGKKK